VLYLSCIVSSLYQLWKKKGFCFGLWRPLCLCLLIEIILLVFGLLKKWLRSVGHHGVCFSGGLAIILLGYRLMGNGNRDLWIMERVFYDKEFIVLVIMVLEALGMRLSLLNWIAAYGKQHGWWRGNYPGV